jgi:hypothetical protein
MENPLQILRDALELSGWELDDIILIAAGIEHPMAILDMADWVVDHPKATWQEIMREKTRLIEKYLINV